MRYARSLTGVLAIVASTGCLAVPACLADSEAGFQASSFAGTSNQANAGRESSNQASGEWGSQSLTQNDTNAQFQGGGLLQDRRQESLPVPWNTLKASIPYLWGANNIPGQNTQWGNDASQPIIPQTTPEPIANAPSTPVLPHAQIIYTGRKVQHMPVQTQLAGRKFNRAM
jgi:hypothetical protein